MRETSKSYLRRKQDPFWNRVFKGAGIDIGAGDDPFRQTWFPNVVSVRPFDVENGDAQVLSRYVKDQFDFVHSSNCLEHLTDPEKALHEWWSVLKFGGYLVFTVPDEDLYEQGKFPSQWNQDHVWTFTLWKEKSWCDKSINVVKLISSLPDCHVVRMQIADTNYDRDLKNVDQTDIGAEAFIEVVLRKKPESVFEPMTFKHSGARGDIIYSLPTIQALGGGKLYLVRESGAYMGRTMSEQELGWFRELLIGQCGIADVQEYDGITVQHNLDRFRSIERRGDRSLVEGHLNALKVSFDPSLAWLDRSRFQPKTIAKVIINRSGRYAGPLRWQELKGWERESAFIGFPEEHIAFQKMTGIDVPLYLPESYVDICRVLLGSSLFVGNQSFVYSLAEALKVNRVQEACLLCTNCLPRSDNGHVVLSQAILRHYVHGQGEKQDIICRVHPLLRVRNRFSGTSLPKSLRLCVPIYGRPMVSCVVLCRNEKNDELLSCLSNLPSKEVVLLKSSSSCGEIIRAISKTTSDLICIMEQDVRVYGTWIMDLCGMMNSPDVGAVGPRMTLSPFPHVRKIALVPRRVFHDTGLFTTGEGDLWEKFALCMKNHGYLVRQSLSGNIKIGE